MHVSLICRCIVGEIKETGHLSRIASRSIEYITVSTGDNETIRCTHHRLYVSTNFILSHIYIQVFVTIGPNRNFTKLNLNFVVKRNVCEERSDRFGNALREGASKIYHFSHRFKYLCNLTCEQLAL